MFRRDSVDEATNADYSSHWIPYSDLMAGLLGVFALLLIVSVYRLGQPLSELRQKLEPRRRVAEQLKQDFAGEPGVEVSPSGTVRLTEGGVLFESDKTNLLPDGERLLLKIVPVYIDALQQNSDFIEQLYRVRVEGHADTTWGGGSKTLEEAYLHNLELSQGRAESTVEFLLASPDLLAHRDFMMKYFVASGRSSAEPIRDAVTNEINMDESRRIQIDLVLKDEELIRDLLEDLGQQLEGGIR